MSATAAQPGSTVRAQGLFESTGGLHAAGLFAAYAGADRVRFGAPAAVPP